MTNWEFMGYYDLSSLIWYFGTWKWWNHQTWRLWWWWINKNETNYKFEFMWHITSDMIIGCVFSGGKNPGKWHLMGNDDDDDDDDDSSRWTSGFRANHGDFSPDFQGNLAARWETATQHRSAGIVETGAAMGPSSRAISWLVMLNNPI